MSRCRCANHIVAKRSSRTNLSNPLPSDCCSNKKPAFPWRARQKQKNMTAIFAYSSPTVAFVAGDTCRAVPGSPLPSTITCKVHFWSDQAVFGQAGTQFQSELIACMKIAKQQWTDPTTGSVQFDDSESWLHKAYVRCQPLHYQNAVKRNRASLSNGSLLAAYVDVVAGSHGLARYDFSTGTRTTLAGQVAVDGADEMAFLAIANKHLTTLRSSSTGTIALDEWAYRCLADAIARCPTSVGWPADLLIARPDNLGGRLIVQRRINASSTRYHPMFEG